MAKIHCNVKRSDSMAVEPSTVDPDILFLDMATDEGNACIGINPATAQALRDVLNRWLVSRGKR